MLRSVIAGAPRVGMLRYAQRHVLPLLRGKHIFCLPISAAASPAPRDARLVLSLLSARPPHPSISPPFLARSLPPALPPSLHGQAASLRMTAPPHTIDFPSTYSARQRAAGSNVHTRARTHTTRTRTRCGVCVCKRTQECCHMHSARAPPGGWPLTCPWRRRDRALSSRGTQA